MNNKPQNQESVMNGLCVCTEGKTCDQCLFWEKHNTPSGRKAFLQGWMIMTETVVSFSNVPDSFKEKAAGVPISQFIAVKKYHEDRERRRVN